MDIEAYRERRQKLIEEQPKFRKLCMTCFQPDFGCYCQHIRKFDPKIKFVILIHPIEVKRRIATGRMSHLCLEDSELIMGQDFTDNDEVNAILQNPRFHSVILYPGISSVNLTDLSTQERAALFPAEKELAIFVIDGTWATARKMIRSQNLRNLPRICFSPEAPSNFRVRKQPAPGCYSTIEAIHQTIELVGGCRRFNSSEREHDRLLYVFDKMVERQLEFIRTVKTSREDTYRRERNGVRKAVIAEKGA